MSQLVVVVRVDMPGMYIKNMEGGKAQTLGAGAKFTIGDVPEALIKKAQENITFLTKEGKTARAISFMTPMGNWIGIEEAYIPQFKIGKKPSEPEVHEYDKSKKERKSLKKEKEKEEEPPETEEDDLNRDSDAGDGTPITPEADPVPDSDDEVNSEETEENTSEEEISEESSETENEEVAEEKPKSKIVSTKSKKKKKSRG